MHTDCRLFVGSLAAMLVAGSSLAQSASDAPPPSPPVEMPQNVTENVHPVHLLRVDAARLQGQLQTRAARLFILATSFLPVVDTKTIYQNEDNTRALSQSEFDALPEGERGAFRAVPVDREFYYFTRFGSPLAYARPLDLLAGARPDAVNPFKGARLLDFGHGNLAQLWMLATNGATAVGVDVDPALRALYLDEVAPGHVSANPLAGDEVQDGSVTLVTGQWPAEARVAEAVGGEFDFIISKNTLKRGYVRPQQEVDPRFMVHLGVSDEAFVEAAFKALKPGGLFLIYNLSPNQPSGEYVPMADGASPFPRAMVEAAGFEVIAFDQDDSAAARRMGEALRWNEGDRPINLEKELFATYTLLRRPTAANGGPEATGADAPKPAGQ